MKVVSRYLQESVKNFREIIDDEFSPTVSSLEYLRDIDLEAMPLAPPEILNDLASIANIADIEQLANNISQNNSIFNVYILKCFNMKKMFNCIMLVGYDLDFFETERKHY